MSSDSSSLTPSGDRVRSLLGHDLQPAMSRDALRAAERQLAEAQQAFEREPTLDATIWYGRRAAYLFQLERAIAIYSEGIARFPQAHQLYRHRGHRQISLRRFGAAIADLTRAAELAEGLPVEPEPDGMPNHLGLPLSNTHFNIWYHLGLAHYLAGDMGAAAQAYQRCMGFSANADSVVATTDWLYMTYRRLGQRAAAERLIDPIHAGMEVIEDQAYLNRLLMYKGLRQPGDLLAPAHGGDPELELATQGYGVGNWHLYNGDAAAARAIFERVLTTRAVTAFGYIAAEAELARW